MADELYTIRIFVVAAKSETSAIRYVRSFLSEVEGCRDLAIESVFAEDGTVVYGDTSRSLDEVIAEMRLFFAHCLRLRAGTLTEDESYESGFYSWAHRCGWALEDEAARVIETCGTVEAFDPWIHEFFPYEYERPGVGRLTASDSEADVAAGLPSSRWFVIADNGRLFW